MGRIKDNHMLEILRLTAPGMPLRAGLDNILRAGTGALIVGSDDESVLGIVQGGFALNVDFSPAALYELAKMDGAIILSEDFRKIRYANAHLVPDSTFSSLETGIRHRTAERVAKQTGKLVIAISQRRNIISLYQGNHRYLLRDIAYILTKANQAVQILEKYKAGLDKALTNLSTLEFDDNVTMHDVTTVIQRIEMVMRIVEEIEQYIIELGSEGRLINLQVEDLVAQVSEQCTYIFKDYATFDDEDRVRESILKLRELSDEDLMEHESIYKALGYSGTLNSLDLSIAPAGYRLLSQVPRIPTSVVENLVKHFRSLRKIMRASIEALDEVEGIGEVRARAIKEGLRRKREQALFDRFI